MRTQRITKGTALTLLSIMVGGRRYEDYAHELNGTVLTGIPSFVSDGCKVFGLREETPSGKYTYFYLSGYSADGSDVVRALARAMDKAPVYVHKLDMEQTQLWKTDKSWRNAARQMASYMARKTLTSDHFARGDTFVHNHLDQLLDGWNNRGRYQHDGV